MDVRHQYLVLAVIILSEACVSSSIDVVEKNTQSVVRSTTVKQLETDGNRTDTNNNTKVPSFVVRSNATNAKKKFEDPVAKAAQSVSIATQSIVTFATVFVFGCAVVLAVHAWKKFSDAPFRVPLPYQYSALSQFDVQGGDGDDLEAQEEDLENNLHLLAGQDSSTDDDDEVFKKAEVDIENEIDAPATLPVTETTQQPRRTSSTSSASKLNGIKFPPPPRSSTLSSTASASSSNPRQQQQQQQQPKPRSVSSLLDDNESDDEELIN